MHRSSVRWLFAIGLGVGTSSGAVAQSGVASLTHADGAVTLLHAGAPAAAAIGVSLMDGDQIATTTGRAEITFHDGTVAHLDRHARIIVNGGEHLQVLEGRVSMRTGGVKAYVAETAAAKLRVQAGSLVEVTVNAGRRDTLLRVINGSARAETAMGSKQVPDYSTAYVAGPGSGPSVAKVMSAQADEFERWALGRTVMTTSIVLKGTEGGGGVAYAPYGTWYYSSPLYVQYPPYYASPTYVAPYYPPTYFSTPTYYSPSYYSYSAPYSYYNPSSHYPYSSSREAYRWHLPEASTPTPARSLLLGAPIPKP